jgi:N-acetylglucosamine malate deacetylase 1
MAPDPTRPLDLLAVGAHPDDVEISCGGTLALAAAQGRSAGVLDLTRGELASNGTPETRDRESAEAARHLGLALRRNASLPDGAIDSMDAEQVRRVVGILRTLRPRILLTHFPRDRHPDHVEASRLLDRAWYLAGLVRYSAEGSAFRPAARYHFASRIGFEPSFVVDITPTIEAKRRAILAHGSQVGRDAASRPTQLNEPEFLERIEARARHYGGMIGVRYGEPFASAGPIGLSSIEALLSVAGPAPGAFTG